MMTIWLTVPAQMPKTDNTSSVKQTNLATEAYHIINTIK